MKQCLWVLSALLSPFLLLARCQSVQFCQVDSERRSDLCIAVSSVHNESSDAYDLYMTFSLAFDNRQGWCAFGIGDMMDGALMFVMYPGEKAGDVTLSARSTIGHLPPTSIDDQSIATVLEAREEGSYHIIKAICHSCNEWENSAIDVYSSAQPWLFSTHYHQRTRTNDKNFRLVLHTDYGNLKLDMSKSIVVNGDVQHPEITQDRVSSIDGPIPGSINGLPFPTTSANPAHKASSIWTSAQVHGFLMGGSTLILCAGIVAIRSGHKKSFMVHWIVQAVSSVGILAGCSIGIRMSRSPLQLNLWSLHKAIGVIVVILVPLQVYMGYQHHVNFMKFSIRTRISHWHIWTGRVLFLALNMNVTMGLWLAGATIRSQLVWMSIMFVEVMSLVVLWLIRRRRENLDHWRGEYFKVQESEAFVIGEDDATEMVMR